MKKWLSKLFGLTANHPMNGTNRPLVDIHKLVLQLAELRGNGNYAEAIKLYERYYDEIKGNPDEIAPLKEVIYNALEGDDTESIIKYGRRLKAVDSSHPLIGRISENHNL